MAEGGDANTTNTSAKEQVDDSQRCGFPMCCSKKRLKLPFLEGANNSKAALVVLGMAYFVQGFAVNGITNAIYSTIERRFHLSSTDSGIIAACYDTGFCVTSLIVAYLGHKYHKTVMIGYGMLVMALGSLVMALPHFVAPRYEIPNSTYACGYVGECRTTSLTSYRGFFITGQILLGIGGAPLLVLSPVFFDENVKQRYSSTYQGLLFCFVLTGVTLGFVGGSRLLLLFTNMSEKVAINPLSVHWVGNWWIGFLISMSMFILISIPIFMLPKQIPGTEKHRKNREQKKSAEKKNEVETKNFKYKARSFWNRLLAFLTNPTFMFMTLNSALDFGLVTSLAPFTPKYLEAIFGLTAAQAALTFGLVLSIVGMIGNILGGIMISKFKMNVLQMIKFLMVASLVSLAAYGCFFIRCADIDIMGVTAPYHGEDSVSCNSTCGRGCSRTLYDPICGADNNIYTSYCDAGCTRAGFENYANCSRVLDSSGINGLANATAVGGKCAGAACPNVALFIAILSISFLFASVKIQLSNQITLRCVRFENRAFAFGLQLVTLRLLGGIPWPIIHGRVLDMACVLWGEDCGSCGSCATYSKIAASNGMAITGMMTKVATIIFLCLLWTTYKPLGGEYEKEEDAEDEDDPKSDSKAAASYDHKVDVGDE